MRLAIVCVVSSSVESPGEGLSLVAQLLIDHGNLFLVYTCGDVILIEDNIVRASLVVDPVIRYELVVVRQKKSAAKKSKIALPTYQVMVSPLQMVVLAGTNTSSPESAPILTSFVSAA